MIVRFLSVFVALLLCSGGATLVSGAEGAAFDELTSTDRAGILAALEEGRHAMRPVEGGYQARNPGQRWRTRFDGRGFLVTPDAGEWTWGLELVRYGFVGHESEVVGRADARAEAGRVTYAWDDALDEWYVNDRRGLEHGYTLRRRPVEDALEMAGPLVFTIALRGGLSPEVLSGGRGVRFSDAEGVAVLTYTGLVVLDADGRELPALFRTVSGDLCLFIDERGARFPLTVDPIVQQTYLKASNPDAHDDFGRSLAIAGDTVVIGAPYEDSGATGVGGNQSDDSAVDAGAAYVFVRNWGVWTQQAYLKASNSEAADEFGSSVAISGDTIVVGAYFEDSNATGVNGDQSNDLAPLAGAAYVFVRSGTTWSQEAYLKASNTEAADGFGYSVAVEGDTVVVGALTEDSAATGVNGDESDNNADRAGAAYVFVRTGTTWTQEAYLKASTASAWNYFGSSAAISGDTVVVGSHGESSNATGVNGDETDTSASFAGAAYVFVRTGTLWSQQAYLKASNTDPSDQFGSAVAISGDTVLVGAPDEASGATGVNGTQSDNGVAQAGAGYVFVRSGTTWIQEAYLKSSNTDGGDRFGGSVSMFGDTAVIGAYEEDSGSTGVNGDQDNESAAEAGAAYVFLRTGPSWSQIAYLKASNTDANDEFGSSVAVSGETVLVGARGESSLAAGVDGNQNNDAAPAAGAAYTFELDAPAATCQWYCGTGTNVATDGFVLTSPALLGGTFEATITGCSVGSAGAFLAAFSAPLSFPSTWGEILIDVLDPNGELLGQPSAVGTPALIQLAVPNDPFLSGAVFYVQAASFGGTLCLHCAYECTVGYE